MTNENAPLIRRRSSFALIAAALLVASVGTGWGIGRLREQTSGSAERNPVAADGGARGAMLYQLHCATCHGEEGHGDGPASATLRPQPRDFAARPWRFEPTPQSIRRVVLDGIPGTAMPAARANLAEADVELLVNHVLNLSLSPALPTSESSADEPLLREAGFVDMRGSAPPPLRVSDATSASLQLRDLKGRLVVINFWGTACPHCLKEIPDLQRLEAEFKSRPLTILHVCADANDALEAQKALDQVMPGLRALADENGLGLARFEVQTLPATWLIAPDGKAIGRSHGAKDWNSPALRGLLKRWLPVPAESGTIE